ncbi:MAG: hypothetical protein LC723_12970, partial [Actinobacteria bacterium]|nr:hypothetical protein [Actinomycetota bacterium]
MFKLRRGPLPLDKEGVISGIARVDTRTKRLIGKLQPGEVAVIDHDDLDRIAAESLVERKVKAVLNAAPSSTGRYPNLGPLVLMAAGIPLIDSLGPALLAGVKDGDRVNIEGSKVSVGSGLISEGEVITLAIAEERLDECKKDIGAALESFAENTLQYMVTERDFLLEAIRLPEIRASLAGRHVLVVVRGYGYKEDLASLRSSYLRDFRPVLIAVDGGADALLELKLKPDIIIGDMDSVTTQALTCGAELIVHAY